MGHDLFYYITLENIMMAYDDGIKVTKDEKIGDLIRDVLDELWWKLSEVELQYLRDRGDMSK